MSPVAYFKKYDLNYLKFSLLCCLVYFVSYLTRINYGAAISEIVESLHVSNQLAGFAVIGSFITYGLGQPVFGVLGDRLNPRRLIFIGIVATAACNLLVATQSNIYLIIVLWSLNGFFQAMLWPPLVRIIAQTLTNHYYLKTMIVVSAAAAVGTIAVYVLVPVSIYLFSWRLAFLIPAGLAIVTAVFWFAKIDDWIGAAQQERKVVPEETTSAQAGKQISTYRLLLMSGLLPILLVIIFQGALRDGITTWMPTYINDVYELGTSLSILGTAILPIFTIFSVALTTRLQRRVGNELTSAIYLWLLALVPIGILLVVYASSVVVAILLMALLTGCIHGINLLLVSHLPLHFEKYNRISTVSGILNAFTYIGSALSIYVISSLSEAFGWKFTIASWGVIALLGLILCLVSLKRWSRFTVLAAQEEG